MPITNYSFFNWNDSYTYSKWDVIYGAFAGDTRYFYSTRNTNLANNPIGQYSFALPNGTSARTNNVMRLTFTQTGTVFFQAGSVVDITGMAPDVQNYTGVILAGGDGYIDYLNPGLDVSNTMTQGAIRAPIHPYWTTGMWWVPSWSSDVAHEQQVIVASMGEGYSQRTNPSINANILSWNLVFDERTDKEAASLLNFIENHGGAIPFRMPYPIGIIQNRADLKYVCGTPKHRLNSYGLSTVTVGVVQVFDL